MDECFNGASEIVTAKSAHWRLAVDFVARVDNLESTIDLVERLPSQGGGGPAQFIPIRFIHRDKLSRDDRLLLAFDALVLSGTFGRDVGLGRIIYGEEYATHEVRTSLLSNEVRELANKVGALVSANSPPDLVLNRHCPECEFEKQCRKKAIEADDLSLLSGMTANERASHRSKGIFTVTQLSYTFRPRKTPKRAKNPGKPRYMALQALAIRDNTVYVHGRLQLPNSQTQVYLDIEGLPSSESYYLIGALVVSGGGEIFHSFWADQKSDEPAAELVSPVAQKYQKRIQKSGAKLFTFLDHDGVPWNNNNAEHAIKRFAKYRGMPTDVLPSNRCKNTSFWQPYSRPAS